MKVKELIEQLSKFDPDCEVVHSSFDGYSHNREPVYSAEQVVSNTWDCDNNCAVYEVVLQ